MASHREEAQGGLFLFLLPYLPHIFIGPQSHHAQGVHLNPLLSAPENNTQLVTASNKDARAAKY